MDAYFLNSQTDDESEQERGPISWNELLTDANGNRIVYGSWYLYTTKLKEDPKTKEDEILKVLNKVHNNIVHFASISDCLTESDYTDFTVEWVLDHQKIFGISTAEEINSYSLQLVEDLNRYRYKKGYRVPIPVWYGKSFTAVYMMAKANPWMDSKDLEQYVDKVIEENKYIQKKGKPETKLSNIYDFKSLVNNIAFVKKPMENIRPKSKIDPAAYESLVGLLLSTSKKHEESCIQNVVRTLLLPKSKNTNNLKTSTYYDIVFTAIKKKNLAPLMTEKQSARYLFSIITDPNFEKTVNKTAEALWACKIKASYVLIDEFLKEGESSRLQSRVVAYLRKNPNYKEKLSDVCICNNRKNNRKNNGISNEERKSNRLGKVVIDSKGRSQIIINYGSALSVDVLVESEKGYAMVTNVTYDRFSRGRNLLLHQESPVIIPQAVAERIMIHGKSAVELLNEYNNLDKDIESEPEFEF